MYLVTIHHWELTACTLSFVHFCLSFLDESHTNTRADICLSVRLYLSALRLVKNWKVPIVSVKFTAGLQLNKWDLMNLMRPRVTDVYYPEAMRHIVRKRTATNKTPSQNNDDILIRSAGCSFFFFFTKRGRIWFLVLIFRNLSIHRNVFFFSFVPSPLSLLIPLPIFILSCYWYVFHRWCLWTIMNILRLPNIFISTGGACIVFENTTQKSINYLYILL